MEIVTRKIYSSLAVLTLALSFTACQQDPNEGTETKPVEESKALLFKVGGSTPETKSSTGGRHSVRPEVRDMILISAEEGETPLYLEETVTDLDDYYYSADALETKGVPTYTQNFGTMYWEFAAEAYKYDSATDGKNEVKITESTTELTKFEGGSGKFTLYSDATATPLIYQYDFTDGYWPKTGVNNLLFFMSAGVTSAVTSLEYYYSSSTIKNNGKSYNGITKFHYKSPATAAAQTDVLFTSKSIDMDSYNKADLTKGSVLFYHTLAGVKFKYGNKVQDSNGNLVSDGITISKIEIIGIYDEGDCTVTPQYDADGYYVSEDGSNPGIEGAKDNKPKTAKSKSVSVWTPTNTSTGNFSASSLNVVSAFNNDGERIFPDSFYGSDESNDLGADNLMSDNTFKDTFFFIPQETPSGAKIKITYRLTGDKEDRTKEVSFGGHKWYAGELYTYTLTAKELAVNIKDTMAPTNTPTTKSGLKIANGRNTAAYLRVAVIGNWFDSHEAKETSVTPGHVIVNHTWKDNVQYNSGADGDWFQGSDGFWYYKYQVKGMTTIPDERTLFSSYTTPNPSTAAKVGSHLEMSLAVQGVDASKKGTEDWPWPADVVDGLLDKMDDGTNVYDLN